jgi:hypothetical protein
VKPGDAVGFREPARARDHGLAEGARGRIVEIMALAGEGERAVIAFADGRVVAGIPVEDLAADDAPRGG